MASDYVKKLEEELLDTLDKYFPKGKHKDRGKALVVLALAKELGVQGHADYIKSDKFVLLGDGDGR